MNNKLKENLIATSAFIGFMALYVISSFFN